jgi:hypothetical protein
MRFLRTHVPRPQLAVPLLILVVLGLSAWPAAGGHGPRPWPHGRLTYFDASGSGEAVTAAARRWNRSGARVRLIPARTRASADVVFVAEREHLRERCGTRCLGLSSSIGRPASGRVTVRLDPRITGRPTALNVWVAMHEFGHVLGLHHRGDLLADERAGVRRRLRVRRIDQRGPAAVRPRVGRRGGRRAPLRAGHGGAPVPLSPYRTG